MHTARAEGRSSSASLRSSVRERQRRRAREGGDDGVDADSRSTAAPAATGSVRAVALSSGRPCAGTTTPRTGEDDDVAEREQRAAPEVGAEVRRA